MTEDCEGETLEQRVAELEDKVKFLLELTTLLNNNTTLLTKIAQEQSKLMKAQYAKI